jgi:hypothetical protein
MEVSPSSGRTRRASFSSITDGAARPLRSCAHILLCFRGFALPAARPLRALSLHISNCCCQLRSFSRRSLRCACAACPLLRTEPAHLEEESKLKAEDDKSSKTDKLWALMSSYLSSGGFSDC